MVEIMINRDMLEEIDLKRLDNFNNLNINYVSLEYDVGNKYSVPFIAATSVLSVNRDYVKEEITSYNDLLNPKYKNQIVMIDDQRIVIGMALLANGFDMNSVDENELKIAKDWLIKLKNNLKAYDSDSPKNFLITEEAYIGFLWNADAALAKDEKDNIENIFPKEDVAISIDNFVLLKGTKHVDESYEFINYILRADIMKRIVESYPYKNINRETDKLLDESYMNNNAANVSDDIMKNGFFVKNIGENIKLYDIIWAEIK